MDFDGYDISELLIAIGVLTTEEVDENDSAGPWIFYKAKEYFDSMRLRASTTAGQVDDGVVAAERLTKDFLRALIRVEMGTGSDTDIAFFSLLVATTDTEEFFAYCGLLAPNMWS